MKKDVWIFPDPTKCIICKRKMNCHSKLSIKWHKFIWRHFPGYFFSQMDIIVDVQPDGSIHYELIKDGACEWPIKKIHGSRM